MFYFLEWHKTLPLHLLFFHEGFQSICVLPSWVENPAKEKLFRSIIVQESWLCTDI